MQSIDSSILSRIYGRKRGAVVVPNDFLDLGSRRAVDLALHRMAKQGVIRRLARGLYDYPRNHPTLGTLLPSPDTIAKALAGRDQIRLQPAGAYAANLLGLSEQVPAKIVFLTEGPSRTVRIGTMTIQLRHTTPRRAATAGRLSGLVIEALRNKGQAHIEPHHIEHLRRTLPPAERKAFIKDLKFAPVWMHPILRNLAEEDASCD